MANYWKRLSTGQYVDLGALTVNDIDIRDINTALNHINRFGGHFKDAPPLTVAQHTKLVMKLSEMLYPRDKTTLLACLMHDWGEAYYGDVATPIKRLMGAAYKEFTTPIDALIYRKYAPHFAEMNMTDFHEAVKVCDLLSLDIERRSMWKSQLGKDKWPESYGLGTSFNVSLNEKHDLFVWAGKEPFDLEEAYNNL